MTEAENKTDRVQLLMAPSEVTEIDDWGFKNRIRTRAEAIRRLCQIGLNAEANTDTLQTIIQAASEWVLVAQKYLPTQATHGEAENVAPIEKQVNLTTSVLLLTALQILRDHRRLSDSMRIDEEFEAALLKAAEKGQESDETWKFIAAFFREQLEKFPNGGSLRPAESWLNLDEDSVKQGD